MKPAGSETRRFIKFSLLGAVVAAMLLGTGCKTGTINSELSSLKIIRLKGDARVSFNQEPWQAARVGEALPSSCLIQTAKNSRLDIELGPDPTPQNPFAVEHPVSNMLTLFENSVLKIDRLADDLSAPTRTTKLGLRAGVMTGIISLSKAPGIELSTSNVLVETSNGCFKLDASGELNVLKGSVTVGSLAAGTSTDLTAGHRFDPNTGVVSKFDLPSVICGGRGAGLERKDLERFFASFEQRRSSIWSVSPKRGY